MSQGANLFGILSTNSGCAPFIGSGPSARIFAEALPQGGDPTTCVPAFVFNVIAGRPENVIDAPAVADYELLQLDSWAMDADTAQSMMEAARTALDDIDAMIARDIGVKVVAFYPSGFELETRRFKRSIGVAIWSQR